MVLFKVDDTYYAAYADNEYGNPHPKKYACIFNVDARSIPTGSQKEIARKFLKEQNLDYHKIINYKEADINTHDLVNAILKFYKNKELR